MADPDSRAKPAHGLQQWSCDFIRRELIPEMVHDRCFCEPDSREFVEFDSADVEPFDGSDRGTSCELYRATAHVKFSGETCSFPLIVKLPKNSADCQPPSGPFQNEEMFYSKMTRKYGADGVPKCYLSDLGRYGRPVIVLEDLSARGYVRADRKLDEDHLKLCVKALATFHARGLELKAKEFAIFREFYAKLSDSCSDSFGRYRRNAARILDVLESLPEPALVGKIRRKLSENPLDVMEGLAMEINDVSTVCHGRFSRDNVLFRYEGGKPSDVRVIDWQTMRYCSPAIDLGLVLLANLPDDELAKVGLFCRNILRFYLDVVKCEYSEVACDLLQRDIIVKLLSAFVVLCTDETVTDGEMLAMLRVLDNLGTFD
ncbi:uncharacterized protein LOC116851068 [Odontomachus brunneus]|uniref:uncharacterized protein LOC116851068 n=1 Tax=Odontomachus brunneus TaxID=486640 RepID=UPI0013F1821E|nr:uncharacterized protein LOC116851068 [Odontomachus brunneus]XP_032685997.1 uncharacterized protein LOC116851068 [Odontomachus brunneus]XP_032685998.1 uncharacterized protein LOC116851068 [Odontomachus brunneus]